MIQFMKPNKKILKIKKSKMKLIIIIKKNKKVIKVKNPKKLMKKISNLNKKLKINYQKIILTICTLKDGMKKKIKL